MTHWREPHSWKRGLDAGKIWRKSLDAGMFGHFPGGPQIKPQRSWWKAFWRHIEYVPPKPLPMDWAVFWMTVGLAAMVAFIGWVTA